ncbi:MarR family winged helix-turn-helix transcriptional regulator [Nakamurella leprariae]|uniref:Winged helix-turn-helix transcriptional regulator n=1 Tax=Nakamurella leprariae TaxID=2803911 RepID=A0A938YAE7_9ACTN|nr:MarR family winged helix-turn-helix transcriptional regulator [Nakamurella leprariae]MBM9465981.1 winged helix-turn-helix transcriptional regulator [Nakamurella leprariae]
MTNDKSPRWLSREQQDAWVALITMMTTLPTALEAQLRRDAGLSRVEYNVLSWLSMRPEHTGRMSEVAELANVTLSHLSRVASRLEDRGWIQRCPHPVDGRATLARLTATGWEKVVASAPGHAEEVQRLVFDRLDPAQVDQLRTIASCIVDGLPPRRP